MPSPLHPRLVIRILLGPSAYLQLLHRCLLTHRAQHYLELPTEHDKPVRCRADRQSPDIRLQTRSTLAILTHSLRSESLPPPPHRHLPLSRMERSTKTSSRPTVLLLYPRVLGYLTLYPAQKRDPVLKHPQSLRILLISRPLRCQQQGDHPGLVEMVLLRYQDFVVRRQ
jgi:hypothetical protein